MAVTAEFRVADAIERIADTLDRIEAHLQKIALYIPLLDSLPDIIEGNGRGKS